MHCHHHCSLYLSSIKRKFKFQRDLLCFQILLKPLPF
jgi:hypothetical protein